MKTEDQKLQFFEGTNLGPFEVPSGDQYVIREQNLDDDEILSRLDMKGTNDSERLENYNNFIRAIVIEGPQGKRPLTSEEVLNMKNKDKYHILLKSRIHSIGKILKFKTQCRNEACEDGKELKFTEDLEQYDNDFKSNEGKGNGFKFQITPYIDRSNSLYDEFVLSTGRKCRYKYMNGHSELLMVNLAKNSVVSDNSMLYIRQLEVWGDGKWNVVSGLNIFGKKEGIELKARVETHDKQDMLVMECKCPYCKHEWYMPFNAIKDFFFPMEI